MLEKKVVNPSDSMGLGYLNCGTSGMKKGQFVKLAGSWSAGDITALGTNAHKPGYATAGSMKWSPATSGDTTGGTLIGMLDKLEFQRETGDLALDVVNSGEGCVVWTRGEFETDQYVAGVEAATPGTKLFLGLSASTLTTGDDGAGKAVAILLGVKTTFDSNYTATGMIHIRLLDVDGV